MMEITININCPALDHLANAITGAAAVTPEDAANIISAFKTQFPHIGKSADTPAPMNPVSAPIAQMPSAAPVHQMTPAPVAPYVAPPAAPVTEPDYTHEQLGRAAAAYMDKAPANQGKLIQLLQSMGVQAITQLGTREMRTAFANGLRGLGAQV